MQNKRNFLTCRTEHSTEKSSNPDLSKIIVFMIAALIMLVALPIIETICLSKYLIEIVPASNGIDAVKNVGVTAANWIIVFLAAIFFDLLDITGAYFLCNLILRGTSASMKENRQKFLIIASLVSILSTLITLWGILMAPNEVIDAAKDASTYADDFLHSLFTFAP